MIDRNKNKFSRLEPFKTFDVQIESYYLRILTIHT